MPAATRSPAKPVFFDRRAITFLKSLHRHNDRDWFNANKADFLESVFDPTVRLVTALNDRFRRLDADYVTEPKRAMYRIYRDTRFAKDKTPFKRMLGAQFQHPKVTKNLGGGFYFHLADQEFVVAGGIYMPGPDELRAWRQTMIADPTLFRSLCLDGKAPRLLGPPTAVLAARVPKGFESDDATKDLARMTRLYFNLELPAETALMPGLDEFVFERFTAMHPLLKHINDGIISRLLPDEPAAVPRRPKPMF
jgi:uncharacterized protein (TIGR02453 family)